ncbi:hypothetical protein [Nocardia miyunensis]|uniref:hypothetical protein n=1 Tax=Nocardia miyunensis TaxID=282684 RepID=UPI0008334437|nr:hypothetical protein [Nocardia miyunensis]
MLDVLRYPYPWDPRHQAARVIILIVVVLSTIVLIGLGATPRMAAGVLVAAAWATSAVAELVLRPASGTQR